MKKPISKIFHFDKTKMAVMTGNLDFLNIVFMSVDVRTQLLNKYWTGLPELYYVWDVVLLTELLRRYYG